MDSAVSAYRGVLRARQQAVIAREALERARRQLEINGALVEAGRMASQDLVQTEADVANKEYTSVFPETINHPGTIEMVQCAGVE